MRGKVPYRSVVAASLTLSCDVSATDSNSPFSAQGACPPCSVEITLPCRCGESKVTRQCWVRKKEEAEGLSEIRCERVCRALRTCSKHQCGRSVS